jgi:hypothetical protein
MIMARVFIAGREVEIPNGRATVEQLREAAGIPRNRIMVRQDGSGANTVLPRRGPLEIVGDDHFTDMPIAKRGFSANVRALEDDVRDLSYAYEVALDDDCQHLFVRNFNTPPGYNLSIIPVLLELPSDYPESPPGVGGSHLFLPKGLRYRHHRLQDFHEEVGPLGNSEGQWGWWCYERIDWDPCQDNLITFFELLRTDMTNPR